MLFLVPVDHSGFNAYFHLANAKNRSGIIRFEL